MTDPDFKWLKDRHAPTDASDLREGLVKRVSVLISNLIEKKNLPYTLGVFGGWGSGKTTFLAQLAGMLKEDKVNASIVYFNAWKYAGITDLLPALVYKILHYGVPATELSQEEKDDLTSKVLCSLVQKYTGSFGDWAKGKMGINPVDLVRDVVNYDDLKQEVARPVPIEIINQYYNLIDRIQEHLTQILGDVGDASKPLRPVIALVDELDRCDPDEAFGVLKQLRSLFTMRTVPIIFVICANPEPIGLAIKHKYGLESDTGDYEARRILEKFVDAYEDFSDPAPLGEFVRHLWQKEARKKKILPWIVAFDELHKNTGDDDILDSAAYDVMSTRIGPMSNLRLLHKTFEYVTNVERQLVHPHLIWTTWFLELLNQIDPRFRKTLRTIAPQVEQLTRVAHKEIGNLRFKADVSDMDVHRLAFYPFAEGGATLFAQYRSRFWEAARQEHTSLLSKSKDPQAIEQAKMLAWLMADSYRMTYVILLSLIPFDFMPPPSSRESGEVPTFGGEEHNHVFNEFAFLVASY